MYNYNICTLQHCYMLKCLPFIRAAISVIRTGQHIAKSNPVINEAHNNSAEVVAQRQRRNGVPGFITAALAALPLTYWFQSCKATSEWHFV